MAYALSLLEAQAGEYAYLGFTEAYNGWVFPRPINPHVHFRDPVEEWDMFDLVVPESAKIYSWVTAMPNLKENRILTSKQALIYRERIIERASSISAAFDAVVPFHVEEGLDLAGLEKAFELKELEAGKMYPRDGTTNSGNGVDFRKIKNMLPLFMLMERYDIILLVHAEVVRYLNGLLVPDRLREGRAIPIVDWILRHCPKLRVVFEHISSKRGVDAVKRWQAAGYRLEATIAPQYLLWNSTKLFEGGMNPINYSIPILKDEVDRLAIIEFIVSGGGMLGTDSAPHNIWKKSQPCGCPGGIFNEPVSIYVYFHIFRRYGGADWFRKFVDFACYKAARFYKRKPADDNVVLRERDSSVPAIYSKPGQKVLTSVQGMFAGLILPYDLEAA